MISSPILKRSIVLNGRHTSISLEDVFWVALKDIARTKGIGVQQLIGQIGSGRRPTNLSSVLRQHILEWYRDHSRPESGRPSM